jgi:hypothetical protein
LREKALCFQRSNLQQETFSTGSLGSGRRDVIDLSEAVALVAAELGGGGPPEEDVAIVLDHLTIERRWGWVFFYQSRRFVETGDWSSQLAGNAPIIVERETGRLLTTGTAHPVEFYLENYESTGAPHMRPGREIELCSAGQKADRSAAARLLCRVGSVSIGEAKRGVDAVAQGGSFRVTLRTREQAREVRRELDAFGFSSRQLPELTA